MDSDLAGCALSTSRDRHTSRDRVVTEVVTRANIHSFIHFISFIQPILLQYKNIQRKDDIEFAQKQQLKLKSFRQNNTNVKETK